MNKSAFKSHLESAQDAELAFVLPNGAIIPAHAHITEVGRIEKRFIDCGGMHHSHVALSLQAWVDTDVDHRFRAGKLAAIIDLSASLFGSEDPPVEIEYEDTVISQYPVETVRISEGKITFTLGSKHTDCLAKDVCLPVSKDQESTCCSASGCC